MTLLRNYLRENYGSYAGKDFFERPMFNPSIILKIIKDLEGEKEELREDKQSLEEKIKRLKREKMFIEMDNHTTKEDIGYLKTENEELKEESEELKEENERLKKQLDFICSESRKNERDFGRVKKENIERLKEKNKDLKNLVDSYSDNVKCYKRLLEDNNRASAGDVLRTFLVGSIIRQVEEKEENNMGLDLFEVLIARKSESVWGEEIETIYVMAANETQVLQTIEEKNLLGKYDRIEIKPLEYIQ